MSRRWGGSPAIPASEAETRDPQSKLASKTSYVFKLWVWLIEPLPVNKEEGQFQTLTFLLHRKVCPHVHVAILTHSHKYKHLYTHAHNTHKTWKWKQKTKRDLGIVPVIEHLPNEWQGLGSVLRLTTMNQPKNVVAEFSLLSLCCHHSWVLLGYQDLLKASYMIPLCRQNQETSQLVLTTSQ